MLAKMPTKTRTRSEQERSDELAQAGAFVHMWQMAQQHEQGAPHNQSGSNQYRSVRPPVSSSKPKPSKQASRNGPQQPTSESDGTSLAARQTSCSARRQANVMQPLAKLIQKTTNTNENNPPELEEERAGSSRLHQVEMMMMLAISGCIKQEQQICTQQGQAPAIKSTSRAAATCCKVAAATKYGSNKTSRKCASPSANLLIAALTSSYFLLLACAILSQCAPTGTRMTTTKTTTNTPTKTTIEASAPSHQTAHSEQVAMLAAGDGEQQQHQRHHHYHQRHHRHLATGPTVAPAAGLDAGSNGQQLVEAGPQESPSEQLASDSDSGLISVKPIIVFGTTTYNQHSAPKTTTTTAHHKFSEQLEQQRERQLEEANISAQTSVPSAYHRRPEDELAEDEQILLVLASDPVSRSSFRRLIKRSGISDQRLAEIQMIRALKKQLERAASKIATDSNGGGDGGGSAQESAAAIDGQSASTS